MSNKDHIERTKRMIEVMQAYVDGGRVDFLNGSDQWEPKRECSGWFTDSTYRIAPAGTPDTIDWSHVSPEFNHMKRHSIGDACLYDGHPASITLRTMPANVFSSYRKGTVDWKESLVIRPGCE